MKDGDRTGRFLGMPYDWRGPTRERLKQRWWNTQEQKVFVPKAFGWGYAINLHELARRAGLTKRS